MITANSRILVFLGVLALPACSAMVPEHDLAAVSRQTQLACEQDALVSQEQYLAQIKTPAYTSSRSTTWAGGARSDNGKWVFDSALKTCMLHAQQTEIAQP